MGGPGRWHGLRVPDHRERVKLHRSRGYAARWPERTLEIQRHLSPSRPARRAMERCGEYSGGGVKNVAK